MNCASCDHWHPKYDNDVKSDRVYQFADGECRRRSPVLVNSSGEGYWPVTGATKWCGDHQRHPTRRLSE